MFVMRPLKNGMLSKWSYCTSNNYVNHSPNVTLLVFSHKYICGWVQDSLNRISEDIVWKSFNQKGILENDTMLSSVVQHDHHFPNSENSGTASNENVEDDEILF